MPYYIKTGSKEKLERAAPGSFIRVEVLVCSQLELVEPILEHRRHWHEIKFQKEGGDQ